MNEEIKNTSGFEEEEMSLKELIEKAKYYCTYLLSKWYLIVLFGLLGGAIGLAKSLTTKPKYTASLSFALIEKSTGGSGLASLASSFGVSLGGADDGAFSGDNLLEIIQSRYAIEKTLLTPVTIHNRQQNLIEAYLDFSGQRKGWQKSKNASLRTLSFPIGQQRTTFTRLQDSVLCSVYNGIVNSKSLSVARKDKKVSIVNINFTSLDEQFSKLFIEQLMDETYRFYSDTRTAQSLANIKTMQQTADSIKRLYDASISNSAAIAEVNINPAYQMAAVPRIKQESNARLYSTVYAEVLKNLEALKLDMAREKPIVQMVDTPRYPLKKERLGKVRGVGMGGIAGGALIVAFLLGKLYVKKKLEEGEAQVGR